MLRRPWCLCQITGMKMKLNSSIDDPVGDPITRHSFIFSQWVHASYHTETETKWLTFCCWCFKVFFLMKTSQFKIKLYWYISLWADWQYASTVSDNGLVLNRWQAIIWSNKWPNSLAHVWIKQSPWFTYSWAEHLQMFQHLKVTGHQQDQWGILG